jgi:hypothetical protein
LKTSFTLLSIVIFSSICCAQSLFARRGLMDLRKFDFSQQGNVILSGEWEMYMSQLISPAQFANNVNGPRDYVNFPSTWNENSKSLRPGNGYATYHLIMLVRPQHLAFEIPHFYSNYNFWINDQVVANNGHVAATEQESAPQWLPQTVYYTAVKDTLHLVIQISNFHHAKGGLRENIILGTPAKLKLKRQVNVASNVFLFCWLSVVSLLFIFVFVFVKKETSSLYFAGLCFTWALRSMFSNLYVATSLIPELPWELCVKIEYIALYLTMIWAIFFLASIFPQDVNRMFKFFFAGFNLIFIGFTLFTSAAVYTQFLPVYLSFCLILLLYVIYVLIHAVVYERHGVWLIVSCIVLGVVIFAYDLIAYEGFASFNGVIIYVGYLVMFTLMGLCLAYQLELLKRGKRNRDMLTYEDLYGSKKS